MTRAGAEIIPNLVQEEGNYVVTTNQGNEFRGLEAALPEAWCTARRTPAIGMRRRSSIERPKL